MLLWAAGCYRVNGLMQALRLVTLPPTGFRHRDLRDHVARLRGLAPSAYGASAMTYDLRRLRLHGLIERVPHAHRYRLTEAGARAAIFYARVYARALRPAFSLNAVPSRATGPRDAFAQLDRALARVLQEVHLAA